MKMIDSILRKKSLLQFGFGTDVMKATTVCTNCNLMESTKKLFCSKCQARLPRATLYDYYKAQHKNCSSCGTVLSDSMNYCPKCGVRVKELEAL